MLTEAAIDPLFEATSEASFEDVRETLSDLDEHLELCGFPDDLRGTFQLVLAEAMNNIVEHAYFGRDASAGISLLVEETEVGLSAVLVDNGAAMPWETMNRRQSPRRPLLPHFAEEGGYGWSIITALTTDLDYVREGTANRLSFTVIA